MAQSMMQDPADLERIKKEKEILKQILGEDVQGDDFFDVANIEETVV